MSRPCVLIVDDVEANLIALEALLADLPCEVVKASSGNDALRHLLKREFAVMLLDVQMPDMDGFEVARHARDNPTTRDVPIVFITAMHDSPDGILRGYDSGAFDFLFKPLNAHVVRSKVRIFLDLYVNQRRLVDEIDAHKATLAELEAFNYSVSHDLRAPLRPLVGFSEVLISEYADKLDARAVRYLERIRAAGVRMGLLIDDLLQLSRMGRVQLDTQPVDLAAIVREVIADLRTDDVTRAVDVICPTAVAAEGDPGLLRIALENLLRNAWKFTKKRSTARIEFGVVMSNAPTYFVRDDGVGFDPQYAARLFEPFHRLHSEAQFEGTGIGLAIVSRIIGRHGGSIWAESSPDQGAIFRFTLPVPR
jgi:signal transduction histidine kinase